MKTILFLGYSSKKTQIINFLKKQKLKVICTNKPLKEGQNLNIYDLIISFGYKHLISKKIFKRYKRPIINLHMSYLPFNKGAHPNFWSFMDNTPSGVSIHEINEKLDGGNIVLQKLIHFDLNKNKQLTFKSTYETLFLELENLFIRNFKKILLKRYKSHKQVENGTFHKKNQLPKKFIPSWNSKILKVKKNYFKHIIKKQHERLLVINKIEKTRKSNNVNWMNLLKIAIKSNPAETIEVLKKINIDDNKISDLFKKIH